MKKNEMHTNPISKRTNTLCMFLENKFGALERVIGTFTLRGYKIEHLECTQSKVPNLFDLRVSLNCTDKELEKIVKILHNQIHVLEIRLMMESSSSKDSDVAKVV